MLTVDPSARISLDGVLAHPWVTRNTPHSDVHLGPAYVERLRTYALRRRVKVAALVAAFGARHLQRARDLRRVFSAKCLSPADFSALSAAFHRAAVVSAPPGRPPTHTVNIECFRDVLASVEVTASLSADRLFAVFDAGTEQPSQNFLRCPTHLQPHSPRAVCQMAAVTSMPESFWLAWRAPATRTGTNACDCASICLTTTGMVSLLWKKSLACSQCPASIS